MRDQGFTLPAPYLRYLADQVQSSGAAVPGWLSRSGLTEADLADPAQVIPYPRLCSLVLDAIACTREPALGLFVGQRIQANAHGMLGYAAQSSGSLRQAVDLLERYLRLRIGLIAIHTEVQRDEVRVRFTEITALGDIRRPLLEAVVMTLKNILDALTMGACRIRAVAFPFPAPDYASLARDLFGCEVRYGEATAAFTLPADALDAPLRLSDPEAFRAAAQICQRDLDRLAAGDSLAGKVQRLLLERQGGFPTLQVTARLLHLTPRTLHRRLIEEGTSFRAILEEVRRTLAVQQLKSGRCTIEEVAYSLGYSDLANFRRAFKRWEGVAPAAYRARIAVDPKG